MTWSLFRTLSLRPARRATDLHMEAAIADWARRYFAQHVSVSFDQEKRLLAEEWATRHFFSYDQAHLVVALTCSGAVTADVLRESLDATLARHRSLRVVFHQNGSVAGRARESVLHSVRASGVSTPGLYHQRTAGVATVPVVDRKIAMASFEDPDDLRKVIPDSIKPFDLTSSPLLLATLFADGRVTRVLTVAADRLVADWHSMGLVSSEIDSAQARAELGHSSTFTRPTRRARAVLKRECADTIGYWWSQWSRAMPLSIDDFPDALPDPAVRGPWHLASVALPSALVAVLNDLATKLDGGLEFLILCGVLVALHHRTQRTVLSVWMEFRQSSASANMIGPFSTSPLITVDLAYVKSTADLAREVAKVIGDARRHQDVPLEVVWRAMNKSRIHRASSPGQISFRHVTFARRTNLAASMFTEARPLIETDRRMGLQIQSYEDDGKMGIVAAFDAARLPTERVSALLDDVTSILCLLAGGIEHNDTTGSQGPSSRDIALTSVLNGANRALCALCLRRHALDSGKADSMERVQKTKSQGSSQQNYSSAADQ